jgi:hypothetical protein
MGKRVLFLPVHYKTRAAVQGRETFSTPPAPASHPRDIPNNAYHHFLLGAVNDLESSDEAKLSPNHLMLLVDGFVLFGIAIAHVSIGPRGNNQRARKQV